LQQAVCIPEPGMVKLTPVSYLFRYVGQVLGVAASASIIQAILKADLARTITGPHAGEVSLPSSEIWTSRPLDTMLLYLSQHES
jgi:hypothetical protein